MLKSTSRCKGVDFWLLVTGPKRFEGEPLASSNTRNADFNVSRWLQCVQAIQSWQLTRRRVIIYRRVSIGVLFTYWEYSFTETILKDSMVLNVFQNQRLVPFLYSSWNCYVGSNWKCMVGINMSLKHQSSASSHPLNIVQVYLPFLGLATEYHFYITR